LDSVKRLLYKDGCDFLQEHSSRSVTACEAAAMFQTRKYKAGTTEGS